MRFSRSFSVLILCCTFSTLACVEQKANKTGEPARYRLFEAVDEGDLPSLWINEYLKKDGGIQKYRFVALNTSLLSSLKHGEPEQKVILNLFRDVDLTAIVDRRDKRRAVAGFEGDSTIWVWEGHIESDKDSSFAITCHGQKIEGEVRTSRATYEIRPSTDQEPSRKRDRSLHVVIEVKDESLPPCASHELEEPKQLEEHKKKRPEETKEPVKKERKKSGK
jgi:hypothetical protein